MAQTDSAYRPKVLLLIPQLRGGGAEQVTRLLAGRLSSQKYEVHLGLVTQRYAHRGNLPPWVAIYALGARRVRGAAFKLLRLIWRLKPDVVLSNMVNLNFMVLLLRRLFPRKTRVVVRQSATVSLASSSVLPHYTRLLYRLLYRRAGQAICQSNSIARDLMDETDTQPDRIAVLPNPVDAEGIRMAAAPPVQWSGPGPHLLAVGRLSYEQGFDLLLRALSIVRDSFPGATLIIAGSGPEEEALKADCRALGLDCAVYFAGTVDAPYSVFPGATLFVLSSRQEGVPNALLEAAAANLPIVAVPSSGAVVDFLNGRLQSWLASRISAQALAASIIEALLALRRQQRSRGDVPALSVPLGPASAPVSTALL
jgi:glycosyltransferase involved in cell wall biosynthesis